MSYSNQKRLTPSKNPEIPDIDQWKDVKLLGVDFRTELKDMADTVTKLDLWDWFRYENPPPKSGYMFWSHENKRKISEGISCKGHSGASFATAMRNMQYIAKFGFEKWNSIK